MAKVRKALDPEIMPSEDPSEDEEEAVAADPGELDEPDEAEIESLEPAQKRSSKTELADPEISTSAVSAHDPFRRYLEEVRRYPLLEPEEEFKLAMRLKETGDMNAAKTLVSANLRLVIKIAFEYQNFYSNIMDLVQEGNIGLMKAVSKFDPTKGARLGYYSSWWIRSYILKYLLDNFRLVKLGTTQAQKKLFYHLLREKEKLEAQGLLAGPKLLAEKLDVREKDVVEMEQRLSSRGSEVSLDAPLGDGESKTSFVSTLPDPGEAADETLAREEWLQLLTDRLPEFQKNLNEKELQILKERLLAEEPRTLQEVANDYGLTRERARQIEARVIEKLKEYLKDLL